MIGRVLGLGAAMGLMAALVVTSEARAEDEDELYYEKESSVYAELSAGASYFLLDDSEEDNRFSGGVGLTIGGHLSPHFAMEVQYGYQGYSNTQLVSYNLKYIFLTDSVQPWISGGIGMMGGSPGGPPFLFMGRINAGSNFFLTEQWAVAPSVSYAGAKDKDVFLANLGVVYYFE